MGGYRVAFGVALAAVLVVPGTAAAGAGGRAESRQYLAPHGVLINHFTDDYYRDLQTLPPLVFDPRPGERWVSFDVADLSGRQVMVYLHQEPDDPGEEPLDATFCDVSEGPLRLVSAEPVEVRVFHGLCLNHLWSFASRGVITARFSARGGTTAPGGHDHGGRGRVGARFGVGRAE
jgi:hypothetical protein